MSQYLPSVAQMNHIVTTTSLLVRALEDNYCLSDQCDPTSIMLSRRYAVVETVQNLERALNPARLHFRHGEHNNISLRGWSLAEFRALTLVRQILNDIMRAWKLEPLSDAEADGFLIVTKGCRVKRNNLPATEGFNRILPGVQAVTARVNSGRLKVSRACKNLISEVGLYRYPTEQERKIRGENPIDENNHACFVAGTMITTRRGPVAIEALQQDDQVLTRDGFRPIVAHAETDESATVYDLLLSDSRTLRGTANHPIFVPTKGWIALGDLQHRDIIRTDCHVVSVLPVQHKEPVYNLTVQSVPEYYANGILVHNCSALRYLICGIDRVRELGARAPQVIPPDPPPLPDLERDYTKAPEQQRYRTLTAEEKFDGSAEAKRMQREHLESVGWDSFGGAVQ
jgi:hypothetical protein